VELGREYEAEVFGIGHEGEGVGRVNGYTLFIHGALPGEIVKVRVTELKKQYGRAELLTLVHSSPDRVHPPCEIYEECGGCQLQHLSYEAQLRQKRQLVVDQLERIGKLRVRKTGENGGTARGMLGVEGPEQEMKGTQLRRVEQETGETIETRETQQDEESGESPLQDGASERADAEDKGGPLAVSKDSVIVHPTLGMQDAWRYRNKVQVPFGQQEGGLVGGFYKRGSHSIVEMERCLLQHEASDDTVRRVKAIAQELGITGYVPSIHEGLLRHVVVKYAKGTGEVMIVLVVNGDALPHEAEWVKRIRAEVPGVVSICMNVNTERTSLVFGERTQVLWGREVIYDTIGDIRFAISARSFYQVNPIQTEALYNTALAYAGLTGSETVIDAYCGIGTISLFLARHAREVYGVEIVPEAIDDARVNAELNGIHNVRFAVGKAEEVLPAWREQGVRGDVIVVDPPRKGCDPRLLETILAMRPARVVYVSCDPATLARDLRILEDGGYRTVEVQPVDMFPHTVHVECCSLLVWNGNNE
jgi:23S rRNA (uracil1939-C5)-methyltransferase